MANAQIMQDELQQSVVLSEEDAEYEEDETVDTAMVDLVATTAAGSSALAEPSMPNNSADQEKDGSVDNPGDTDLSKDTPEEEDQGDEGEPAERDEDSQDDHDSNSQVDEVHDEEDDAGEDAEGEEDDTVKPPRDEPNGVSSGEEDEEEEEEDEGVGAVKIKPGETDEEEESGSEDEAGSASDGSDEDSVGEWEEAAEIEPDEEDESEVEESNTCIFCKKDEENDPAEEFESYLTCKTCGEHSHQQCAREADALGGKNVGANWKCPECVGDDVDDAASESDAESSPEDAEINGTIEDGDISPASTRRSTVSKIAHEIGLLPSARGVSKPDSHSVFNQLVLDEDPMDGSRVLRKRKTSSAEVDIDDEVISLRKRRKNTADISNPDEANEELEADGADEVVRPRSSRSLRLKISNPAAQQICTVVKKSRSTLLLKVNVGPEDLRQILSRNPVPKKRSSRAVGSRPPRSSTAARSTAAAAAEPLMAPFISSSYSQPFYSFYDKETDENKAKPYGGILTEIEADTSKTLPTKEDRRRFDEAKQKADAEWRTRLLAMQAEMDVPIKKTKKASGPASQIECIEFGGWEIDTWYAAPYPEEYSRNRVLYICEFCLKYMNSDYVAWRHKLKCPAKHPPGDEIYRHGSVSFFEVDGRKNPVYCQNLCLLAKLFLGSKTLYYDVEPFLFYVLCEYDDMGYHFVGYFSKEKRASSQNNVSCILTLPIHQRKGYGNLLIDFSYLLTRVEEKTGSPEKPLSDMGLVSYRNYWRLVLCRYLLEHTPMDKSRRQGLSIRQISDDTGMMPDDVISALEGLRCLVRDPQTQVYAFRVDLAFCREYVDKWESKGYVKLNDHALTWTPYVMGRSNATNFELGPALNAIAPREEDEDSKTVQVLAASGIATGDFGNVNGGSQKPLEEMETTVLESTEPNDNAIDIPREMAKPNGVGKENADPSGENRGPSSIEAAAAPADDGVEDDWMSPYNEIPVVRFEVFPPINPKRPAATRTLSSLARPPTIRAPATAPRPRPRRSMGGSTRKSASRPKASSSSRRKTGGTGRGPGRWPKGTKKSDYGNADSGPGLPPAWIEKRVSVGASSKPADTKDTVEVAGGAGKTPKAQTSSARFEVMDEDVGADIPAKTEDGDDDEEEEDESSGSSSSSEEESEVEVELDKAESDPDVEMGEDLDDEEDEDEDAEGEDE